MKTVRFLGFSFRPGGPMVASLEILDKDWWEPEHLTVPIILAPDEEPSEEHILDIIADAIRQTEEYRQPFQPFLDKYKNREILMDGDETPDEVTP